MCTRLRGQCLIEQFPSSATDFRELSIILRSTFNITAETTFFQLLDRLLGGMEAHCQAFGAS